MCPQGWGPICEKRGMRKCLESMHSPPTLQFYGFVVAARCYRFCFCGWSFIFDEEPYFQDDDEDYMVEFENELQDLKQPKIVKEIFKLKKLYQQFMLIVETFFENSSNPTTELNEFCTEGCEV